MLCNVLFKVCCEGYVCQLQCFVFMMYSECCACVPGVLRLDCVVKVVCACQVLCSEMESEIEIREEMAIAMLTSTSPSLDLSYCPSADSSPLYLQ